MPLNAHSNCPSVAHRHSGGLSICSMYLSIMLEIYLDHIKLKSHFHCVVANWWSGWNKITNQKWKKKSESDRNKRGFIPKCVIFILYDAILFSYIDWRQFESMMTRKRRNIPIHVEWSESVFWNRNWWVFYLLVEWDLFLAILYVALSESLQIWLYHYQDFFSIFTFEHHANFGQYSAKNSRNIWEILQNIIIKKYI